MGAPLIVKVHYQIVMFPLKTPGWVFELVSCLCTAGSLLWKKHPQCIRCGWWDKCIDPASLYCVILTNPHTHLHSVDILGLLFKEISERILREEGLSENKVNKTGKFILIPDINTLWLFGPGIMKMDLVFLVLLKTSILVLLWKWSSGRSQLWVMLLLIWKMKIFVLGSGMLYLWGAVLYIQFTVLSRHGFNEQFQGTKMEDSFSFRWDRFNDACTFLWKMHRMQRLCSLCLSEMCFSRRNRNTPRLQRAACNLWLSSALCVSCSLPEPSFISIYVQ